MKFALDSWEEKEVLGCADKSIQRILLDSVCRDSGDAKVTSTRFLIVKHIHAYLYNI